MVAHVIDGKAFAARLRGRVADEVAQLKSRDGIVPGLAVVLVGEDPASQVYVRNKSRQTVETGMSSFKKVFDKDASQAELLGHLDQLNNNPEVHGILVQLPLPDQMNANAVIDAINPAKDVDGFHISNVGLLGTGREGMVPCTPLGCLMLLRDLHVDLSGMNAVVIGRSNIVGKPMANLLLKENCTVTIAHSRTRDLPDVCRSADILVAAVGRPEFVQGGWIRNGATVIDVGINRVPAPELGEGKYRIAGDVAFDGAKEVAGAITPVPGGVGPMTIACLLVNTLMACRRSIGCGMPEGLVA